MSIADTSLLLQTTRAGAAQHGTLRLMAEGVQRIR